MAHRRRAARLSLFARISHWLCVRVSAWRQVTAPLGGSISDLRRFHAITIFNSAAGGHPPAAPIETPQGASTLFQACFIANSNTLPSVDSSPHNNARCHWLNSIRELRPNNRTVGGQRLYQSGNTRSTGKRGRCFIVLWSQAPPD